MQSKQALGQLCKNSIASFVFYGMWMRPTPLKGVIHPTLLAFSISNIRGKPCVISSSVYSSSWMDLNSFSKHWMRGRRCCWKDVRKDSSHVCSVQGTPTDRGQSSLPASEKDVPFCFFTSSYVNLKILSKGCQITLEVKFAFIRDWEGWWLSAHPRVNAQRLSSKC